MKLSQAELEERKILKKRWDEYHAWIKSFDKTERFKALVDLKKSGIAIEPDLLWAELLMSRKDA